MVSTVQRPQQGTPYIMRYRGETLRDMFAVVLDDSVHIDPYIEKPFVWAVLAVGNPRDGLTLKNQAFRLYLEDIVKALEV